MTRPLGANIGDMLTKPFKEGGFAMDRFVATLITGVVIFIGIILSSPEHSVRRKKDE